MTTPDPFRAPPLHCSRGIGLSLVKGFLARNNAVIATSRKTADAKDLQELRKRYPQQLTLTDMDATSSASITQ